MSTSSKPGFHHVAYACRDIDATHQFYEELMGFHLVHTEVVEMEGGFFRHTFYDTGDGSCLAFFDLHGIGEQDDWDSAISTGNGLPVWVNHVAFSATEEKQNEVKERMELAGVKPLMEVDHGWCHSLYYVDPERHHGRVLPGHPGHRARLREGQEPAACHGEPLRGEDLHLLSGSGCGPGRLRH